MRQTIPLNEDWQTDRSAGSYQYERSFDLSEDFCDGRIYLEFDNMSPAVDISVNGSEVAAPREAPMRRIKVADWVHAGPNEITLRSPDELSDEAFIRARIVSYDKVSIADIDIDPEITAGNVANVWITISVDNHTTEEQNVLASIVVGQDDCREKVEVVGEISPFGGEIEAVIRITDPEMWEPDESGQPRMFECLIGLQAEGEVMDVAAVRFDVG